MRSSANVLAFVKELTQLKIVQPSRVADANHGVKRNRTCAPRSHPLSTMAMVVDHPRSYAYKSSKVRRLALKSVYSEKVAENKFVAVDSLEFTAPKLLNCKSFSLSIDSKVLVILEE